MTKKEYEQKKDAIVTSDAPFEKRERALINLMLQYESQFIDKKALVENGEVKSEEL